MLWAGYLAEAIAHRGAVLPLDDLKKIGGLEARAGGVRSIEALKDEAEAEVREHWPAVEGVAEALLEHETLTGRTIRRLVLVDNSP
jgi:hypothetical protein